MHRATKDLTAKSSLHPTSKTATLALSRSRLLLDHYAALSKRLSSHSEAKFEGTAAQNPQRVSNVHAATQHSVVNDGDSMSDRPRLSAHLLILLVK